MFWEFWEAGTAKLRGSNWFGDIPWADWQKGFPWPFSTLPTEINWLAATWGELVFAMLILVGLIVGVGTSAPLLSRLWGEPAQVGPDFYNSVGYWLAVVFAAFLGAPRPTWGFERQSG